MSWFWENTGLHTYLKESVQKVLFESKNIWEILQNTQWWTNEQLDWSERKNQKIKRTLQKCSWWRFLQGSGIIEGRLLWWCIEVFLTMFWTEIWPPKKQWEWKILFIETSEEQISNADFERILRTIWAQWILWELNGIIMWRAHDEKNYDESLIKIIVWEYWFDNLTIVTNMDFGHTEPIMTLPIWAEMTIDSTEKKIFIYESWVI
jgi:muramoyltetrapeptide carboxypeptidase LdcA involved in peptidoglycan recycling